MRSFDGTSFFPMPLQQLLGRPLPQIAHHREVLRLAAIGEKLSLFAAYAQGPDSATVPDTGSPHFLPERTPPRHTPFSVDKVCPFWFGREHDLRAFIHGISTPPLTVMFPFSDRFAAEVVCHFMKTACRYRQRVSFCISVTQHRAKMGCCATFGREAPRVHSLSERKCLRREHF